MWRKPEYCKEQGGPGINSPVFRWAATFPSVHIWANFRQLELRDYDLMNGSGFILFIIRKLFGAVLDIGCVFKGLFLGDRLDVKNAL